MGKRVWFIVALIFSFGFVAASMHASGQESVESEARIDGSRSNFDLIHEAAKKGDVETIRSELRKGVPVDLRVKNSGGLHSWLETTPLMWAASRGHAEAVGLLIRSGANVDARSIDGTTPMMAAAGGIITTQGDPLTCLQLLIDAGAEN